MATRSRGLAALLSSLLVLVSALAYYSLVLRDSGSHVKHALSPAGRGKFTAPKTNIWAGLSEKEAEEVHEFLTKEWAGYNLTRTPTSGTDNYIYALENLQPNKSDAVPYLHGNRDAPGRWAKAVLFLNTGGLPMLEYHAVGPLPVSSETKVVPLTYPFSSGRNQVIFPFSDLLAAIDWSVSLAESVSDITLELLGAKVNRKDPTHPDSLLAFPMFRSLDSKRLIGWVQLFRPDKRNTATQLLPQGIYVKVDASNHNISEWVASDWFYNGKMYASVDEFRAAIWKPDFAKTPPNINGPWTDTEDFEAQPDGRELPPPISVQPYGPRYKLDKNEKYVSWFGFEFYFTTTQATGVSLFDVRFKGERVMYELSLQEAMAHYAGDDPMASSQEFLDTFFGMGTLAFELVPGYDCPAYADFVDTAIHRAGQTERLPNNICLFEYTSDHLLSRHTTQTSVTVSRNTYLTLRSVSTVGNYDYTIDYIFYMDGTIEVKVRASGYIFGAFYANNTIKNEDEFGHRIHDALSSSVHDHVISFKADLDIAGPKNDMVRLALEPMTASYPWDKPEIQSRNTMHLKEYPVTEETGLEWPKNSGELFLVYSSDQKNAWGERKGYRIVSGTGIGNTPHLTILNSTTLMNSAKWAEKDIWVLRQKDTEPRGADPLNYVSPSDPLVDFSRLANGESLVHDSEDEEYDGDLVFYVNVGSHHVPHSGDIPNTLMHTSASSVMFVPHNFADRDPSRESVQGVRLQLSGKARKGWQAAAENEDEGKNEDLRVRNGEDKDKGKGGHKLHKGANYFGTPYREDLSLPLKSLEPNLEEEYVSSEIAVTDLSMNGSAAGLWHKI